MKIPTIGVQPYRLDSPNVDSGDLTAYFGMTAAMVQMNKRRAIPPLCESIDLDYVLEWHIMAQNSRQYEAAESG